MIVLMSMGDFGSGNNPSPQHDPYELSASEGPQVHRHVSSIYKVVVVGIGLLFLSFIGYVFFDSRTDGNLARQSDQLAVEEQQEIQRLNLDDAEVTHFTSSIFRGSIAFSPDTVWVANGHGLLRFNTTTEEIVTYSEVDGMLSTYTTEVAYYDNSIWVVSRDWGVNHEAGISRLNLEDNTWQTYRSSDHDMGRLLGAEFQIESGKLSLVTDETFYDTFVQTSVFDDDSQSWVVTREQDLIRERVFTNDEWDALLATYDADFRSRIERTNEAQCAHRRFGGPRQDQLGRYPLSGGLARQGDTIWYGCLSGLLAIDEANQTVKFVGPGSEYPVVVYDVLSAKDGVFFAHTNLGLGLYAPATKKWVKVRDSLQSYNGADFEWWNSAVWIDDKIYFMEFRFEDPAQITARIVSLWLYEVNEQTLRDVTPTPQSTLQDSYAILPYILQPTTDGKSLMFKSGQQVFIYTPSVPHPTTVTLDYRADESGTLAEKYWGYNEHGNKTWYLTDKFLGEISPIGELERIQPPDGYEADLSYCMSGNGSYVVVVGGRFNDSDLFVYNVESRTWDTNLLNHAGVRLVSCSDEDRLLIDEGRFKDVYLTDSHSESLTKVEAPISSDNNGVEINPARLLAIPLQSGLVLALNDHVALHNRDTSHIFYDDSAIWIRHDFTGFTRISN